MSFCLCTYNAVYLTSPGLKSCIPTTAPKQVSHYAAAILAPHRYLVCSITPDLTGPKMYSRERRDQCRASICPFLAVMGDNPHIEIHVACCLRWSFRRPRYMETQYRGEWLTNLDTGSVELLFRALSAQPVTRAQTKWSAYLNNSVEEVWVTPFPELELEVVINCSVAEP